MWFNSQVYCWLIASPHHIHPSGNLLAIYQQRYTDSFWHRAIFATLKHWVVDLDKLMAVSLVVFGYIEVPDFFIG
jgi:hypothetical protein